MKILNGWAWPEIDEFMCREQKADGTYQGDHLATALEHVTNWSLAIDGGAHVGTWSRLLAARFVTVIACEPSTDTFEALVENMRVYGCSNVVCRQIALGESAGTVSMVLDGKGLAMQNTGARWAGPGGDVWRERIDDWDLPSLGFLKLDVEGSEPMVLRGAVATIQRCRPIVLFEDKFLWRRYGLARDEPHTILAGLGYQPIVRAGIDEILGAPVKLLIIGATRKASWAIRGEQLGAALGARLTTDPTPADWDWLSVHHRAGTPAAVVLIKRAGPQYARQAQRWNLPIVWDALDFWSQPRDNALSEPEARALLARAVDEIRPRVFIGATPAMAAAGDGLFVPHHAWAGLVPTPARAQIAVVAYQGNPRFLGQWHEILDRECQRRGWQFVVNPPDLGAADLIVAFRDGPWDGWICRQWKSGIKAVNALAAGRPFLSQDCEGAGEGIGSLVETPADLSLAFEIWRDPRPRQTLAALAGRRARARTVEAVAAQYRTALERIWQVAA